ncbi:MAG: hypothetical protein KDD11_17205, partial [Acidobacteria bacterium]|nr:hypothetical protein [Acidobacteriota bacterium]
AGEIKGAEAFDRIKTLAGTWNSVSGEADAKDETWTHEFRVSAAGSVVMEIMAPESPYEMINMYHLDGGELVLTHYCAAGNQPTMRLDTAASDADHYVFTFTGGTNLDPAVDTHIHAGEIDFEGDNSLESKWTGWSQGKPGDTSAFHLVRAGS